MAFRRENGRVYLDMSEDDFDALLVTIGYAAGSTPTKSAERAFLRIANVLNEGNPQFTPYDIADDPPPATDRASPRSPA